MRTTATNPAGIQSFDLTQLRGLGEFQFAVRALDRLVKAMKREETDLTQEQWLEAVANMAASLPFGDCCDPCMRRGPNNPDDSPPLEQDERFRPVFPHCIEIDGEALTGSYRCPACAHEWTCSWAVDTPAWLDWA